MLALAIGGPLALPACALAGFITPESGGSPNANAIDSLYKIILYVAAVVFFAVVGVLVTAVYRFRAKKHPVALQIHGHTRLEMGLTLGAAGILVILAIVTFVKLPSILDAPNSRAGADQVLSASLTAPIPPSGDRLTICVTGRQFIWQYTYDLGPSRSADCNKSAYFSRLPYSYQEMYVPAGVTVDLLIQSRDVIHAWWVPALGGKVDAVPGYTTYTWFRADKVGAVYRGQCAQLCGRQHAFMTALVKVLTPGRWAQWIHSQQALIAAQNGQVAQLRQLLIRDGSLTSSGNF